MNLNNHRKYSDITNTAEEYGGKFQSKTNCWSWTLLKSPNLQDWYTKPTLVDKYWNTYRYVSMYQYKEKKMCTFMCSKALSYTMVLSCADLADAHFLTGSKKFEIHRFIHGHLYRWTENSFPFFLYLKPVEILKKCFNTIWTSLKVV